MTDVGTEQETGYYFDWDRLFTNDPRYTNRLSRGLHNQVYCNGVAIRDAKRFLTGPDGWVEFIKRDEEGTPLVDLKKGEVVTETVYGKVEYVCTRQ